MRTRRDIRCLATGALIAAVILGTVMPAAAVDDGGGRSVFATGAGNRALAMGGAFAAVADDASAPIWNPAGLGLLARKELQLSQTTLFGLGFSEQYAAFALPDWRWGTVALTWRRFGVDGIEGRDDRGFLVDADLEDSETELGLSYGRSLLDGDLSLGGALKVQRQSLAGYTGSGFGLDLGAWARPLALAGATGAPARALAVGVAVRNAVEPEIRLDQDRVPDPGALRAGLAWTQDVTGGIRLVAAVDIEKTRGMDRRLHLGAECRVYDVLAVRAGSADGRLTGGAGVSWHGLGFDYQYEDHPLDPVHRFGVALGFGATVAESRAAAHAADEAAIQARLEAAFSERNAQRMQQLRDEIDADLRAGRYDDALARIGTLQVLAPERDDLGSLAAAAWSGLAVEQERRDDLTVAAVSWRRALSTEPDNAAAQRGLARVQAESDRRSTRSREIRERYEAALDAFAREDLATARDGFATVVQMAPADQDAAAMLARTNRALTHRATALADEATALVQGGQLAAAQERLEQARRLDPQAPRLAAATAELVRRQELAARPPTMPQSASEARGPALAPAAANPPAPVLSPERQRELADLYRRGADAMQAGRRADAVRYWELVWASDPDYEQVRAHLIREYLAVGMEAYAAGSLREAVASWEQALRVDPDDPRARGYLERAHQQLSRMEKISSGR